MSIPDRNQCYAILRERGVPPHIVAHCELVAKIGVFLARALNEVGEHLNVPLVEAAGLLHDLTKHESLVTGENHALSAARVLEELGYPEVARIVAQHIFLLPGPPGSPLREEEIVYYADKRVKHTEIVSLKERFDDLRVRYAKGVGSLIRLYHLEELTRLLERRIFKKLSFDPDQLKELVSEGN